MIISLHLHKCLRVVFFCDWHTKHSREELPTSKVRGRSWEDPMPEGRRPRGVTPRLRSGAAAERRYPANEVRGSGREELPHVPTPEVKGCSREELPYARGQGRRPGGPTPRPRSSGCAEGLEELSHVEGQEGLR